MRSVVITGASSGIGYASAKHLLNRGFKVYGSVRKQDDADRLSQELGSAFKPLLFDVQDEEAIRTVAQGLRQELKGQTLHGLVLNAGIAVFGPLLHLGSADLRRQLEVNLVAQLVLTQAFAPLLGVDPGLHGGPGRIVAISSTSGKLALPFTGAYSASKHGFEAFCHTLRRELMLYGIDVIIIGPGPVTTPIWGKRDDAAAEVFARSDYAGPWSKFREVTAQAEADALPASRVAELVLHALTVAGPKARYAPVPKKFVNWVFPQLLPARVVDRIMAKLFGMERRA